MIVVLDVGNTNIVIGVYRNDNLIHSWRIGTDKEKTADEFGMLFLGLFHSEKLSIQDIEGVIISSVVPPIMFSLERAVKKYLKKQPFHVDPSRSGMPIKYGNPKELGADRIVNAVAAFELYQSSLIIIDFGTATTFCAINSKGEYLGGCISPGVKISADALFQKTAKLPKIDLSIPDAVICNETVKSMQAGILIGYIGMVDHLVIEMKKEMNEQDVKVVATGGLASMIASKSSVIDLVNASLTLEGLNILYRRMSQQ